MFVRWLLLISFALLPQIAHAQDTNGYVPPPMFGSTPTPTPIQKTPPKQEPQKPKQIIKKQVQKVLTPVVKAKVVAPKPNQKPIQKTKIEPVKQAQKEAKPKPKEKALKPPAEPIDLISKKVEKKKSTGVVKGPKVMPSVQKKKVQAEVIFEPENKDIQVGLIDRVQKLNATEPIKAENIAPTDGRDKQITLFFKETESDIADDSMLAGIISYATGFKDQSVYIQSYASSGYSQSLKRALNIRKQFIKDGISPFRINLLAHGNKNDGGPTDRLDITVK